MFLFTVVSPDVRGLTLSLSHALMRKSPSFLSVALLILTILLSTSELVCHFVVLALVQEEAVGTMLQGLQLGKLLRSRHADKLIMILRYPFGVTGMTPPILALLAMTMLAIVKVLSVIHLTELLMMPSFSKFIC